METVDWSQNPLGDKSEARGVRVDEDKPVEVKVRQRGQLPASGGATTFIKDLGKKIQGEFKEHLDAKSSEKEHIKAT